MSKTTTPSIVPATEVPSKQPRRSFTAEYKRRIVAEADQCTEPGQTGALLRREGLYTSHLSQWRRARDRGELAGPTPKRGPKPRPKDARDRRIQELEQENRRLKKRAWRAEALVELQEKVSDLLRQDDDDETP